MTKELYSDMILDHNKNPKNFGKLSHSTNTAQSKNTLCGDQVTIEMDIKKNVIRDIRFSGCGCAILKASASLMTDELKGKTVEEAKALFSTFESIISEEQPESQKDSKLFIFTNIRKFPSRVKCASLPWHTMKNAINNK